jgi:hypothetical protein
LQGFGFHVRTIRQLHPELAEKLYTDFQQLYRDRYKSKYESAMCWGFDCGDGWYQLLYDLSQELSNYLAANLALDFEVVQVKSKFGILHFHLNYRDAATDKIIALARQRASVTCELTGKPRQLCVNATFNIPAMVLCLEKAAELGFAVVDSNAGRMD